ncbi:conserved exported hypothetical protein [Verrucomicrobia bacterium]|nr:conserved exported hypothetical protein [Verrucomicrobiota bacterium]
MALALLALSSLTLQLSTYAQGTAFTYQGRLNSGGTPANGSFDLTFTLFNTNANGVAVAGPVTNNAIPVSNGLFTTAIDFGGGAFAGSSNWLEIAVRATGSGSFNTLVPRQELTPTPYAITAENLAQVVQFNTLIPGEFQVVGGGDANTVSNYFSTVGGGLLNTASGANATVGGGGGNQASGNTATVGGGYADYSTGDYSTVGGGNNNVSSGTFGTVAGGYDNAASGYAATVGGGYQNSSSGDEATVGGGYHNLSSSTLATVGGGYYSTATGFGAFVGGGGFDGSLYGGNNASGHASTVDGGLGNTNTGNYSTICGGAYNYCWINGYETITGGSHNYCSGDHATICGGAGNLSAGYCSFAAGKSAQAVNDGSFVWNDDSGATTYSTANNQFMARASGGFVFYTGTGSGGAQLAAGATSWTTLSDRNAKKNLKPVDAEAVLDKLAAIPIQQWNYKWEKDTDVPNIGPMAQDFKRAFYPGRDDKGISTLEFDGVELAAIKGLNERLKEKQAEIETLKARAAKVDSLEKRLEELERAMQSLAAKK